VHNLFDVRGQLAADTSIPVGVSILEPRTIGLRLSRDF